MNHSKKLRPTQRVSRNHRSIHLLTQISFLHLIIIHHILRIPTQNDLPRLKHIRLIRDRKRLLRILLDQENRHTVAVDTLDNVKHLIHIDRRQTHRRLVKNDQLRVAHESAAHGEHLLLTAGESTGWLVHTLLQTRETLVDHVQRRFHLRLVLSRISAQL